MSCSKNTKSVNSYSGYKKVKKSYSWKPAFTCIGARNVRCWYHPLTNEVSWGEEEPESLIRYEYESVAEIVNLKPLPMKTEATITENEPSKMKLR